MTKLPEIASIQEEARLGHTAYGRFLKPRVAEVLGAVGLDVEYSRAEGDYLFYRDASGEEVRVLDMVGGFGASLFGHNHPLLVDRATAVLVARRPFNAQVSIHGLAGRLCERLSSRVKRATGRDYVTTLASTGAEAIEAALKLAELDRASRIRVRVEEIARVGFAHRAQSRSNGEARLAHGALERASQFLGEPIASIEALITRAAAHAGRALRAPPVFIALEKAFHGKSTGALSLTANAHYREAWSSIGLRTVFLPAGDEAGLARAIDAASIRYLALLVEDGVLDVEERSFVGIAAAFVEPLQGEGGVREVPATYLRAMRAAADAHGFLLVFDEIQCGMGRTGTFLASEPSGVRADAYALSKSLGGGLAKISALLVDRARYDSEFGLLHTSTFAEDDHSSAIALGVLDLLEHDGDALLRSCVEKGEHLRTRLTKLARAYPGQIRDVRGRGLMVGLEFVRTELSPSPFLRVACEQDLLGYVLAAHLLREERIRVAPTLSSPETIRLQPSAYVELAELDRFCEALERAVIALRDRDVVRLAGHLAGRPPGSRPVVVREGVAPPVRRPDARTKVAFLGHFLDPDDVRDWDPGFAPLTRDECRALLDRTRQVLDPFVVHEARVLSANGDEVDVTVIGLAFSPDQVMASFRVGDAKWARDLIGRGVELAKERGARVVGFGGYTSIVTDNCRDFAHEDLLVTSGNSLTTAAAVEAVLSARERLGLGDIRLGVVGAVGNIGAVLAEALAGHADRIVLVGRPGAKRRLDERADRLYASTVGHWVATGEARGVARAVAASSVGRACRELIERRSVAADGSDTVSALLEAMAVVAAGEALRRSIDGDGEAVGALVRASLGDEAPIVVATDPVALRECNVIIAATNSPQPVIEARHLGPGPVVICDVAVPGDVDPRLPRERPDVTVLKGGMVRLPRGQRLRVQGMPTEGAEIYGCLAETILMGFAMLEESLSLGALRVEGVRRARDLALAHGFEFGERPSRRMRT